MRLFSGRLNLLPVLHTDNIVDGFRANIEHLGQFVTTQSSDAISSICTANNSYLQGIQLATRMFVAVEESSIPLFVVCIALIGTPRQIIHRIIGNTVWTMTSKHTRWARRDKGFKDKSCNRSNVSTPIFHQTDPFSPSLVGNCFQPSHGLWSRGSTYNPSGMNFALLGNKIAREIFYWFQHGYEYTTFSKRSQFA